MAGWDYARRMEAIGGWTPKLIDGAYWFDSSNPATRFQDSAMTLYSAVGDPIGAILDSNGSGETFIQETTSSKPTTTANAINGRTVAVYDGINDVLFNAALGAQFAGSDTPFSIAIVFKQTSVINHQGACSLLGATAVHELRPLDGGIGYYWRRRDDALSSAGNTVGINDTSPHPHILAVIFSGTIISIYEDGALIENAAACDVGACTFTAFVMGAVNLSAGYPFNGPIGDLVVVPRAINTSVRAKLEGFMAKRWGISVS